MPVTKHLGFNFRHIRLCLCFTFDFFNVVFVHYTQKVKFNSGFAEAFKCEFLHIRNSGNSKRIAVCKSYCCTVHIKLCITVCYSFVSYCDYRIFNITFVKFI